MVAMAALGIIDRNAILRSGPRQRHTERLQQPAPEPDPQPTNPERPPGGGV